MSRLPLLEQRIKERIQHVKNNVHPAHNPIYLETLNIEVETLNWALNEITALRNSLRLKELNGKNHSKLVINEQRIVGQQI